MVQAEMFCRVRAAGEAHGKDLRSCPLSPRFPWADIPPLGPEQPPLSTRRRCYHREPDGVCCRT